MRHEDPKIATMLFAAGYESERPPECGPAKHRLHDELAALVIAETLKRGISSDAKVVATEIRRVGLAMQRRQVESYFQGRYKPPKGTIHAVARTLKLPELRIVSEWPWPLLTDRDLPLPAIEAILDPLPETVFRLPSVHTRSFNGREKSRWHMPAKFCPLEFSLREPRKPEEFWRYVAAFRVALAQRDYASANQHFWDIVVHLSSIATHPSVIPHAGRLYSCLRLMTHRLEPQFTWFSVNWDVVRECISSGDYGPRAKRGPFSNIFRGNALHLGRAIGLVEMYNLASDRSAQKAVPTIPFGTLLASIL